MEGVGLHRTNTIRRIFLIFVQTRKQIQSEVKQMGRTINVYKFLYFCLQIKRKTKIS